MKALIVRVAGRRGAHVVAESDESGRFSPALELSPGTYRVEWPDAGVVRIVATERTYFLRLLPAPSAG